MTHAIDCDMDEDCTCGGWTADLHHPSCYDRKGNRVPTVDIGETVHYVLDNGPRSGELRPAFVVRLVDGAPPGVMRLCILADDKLDGVVYCGPTYRDVEYDAERGLGTWHLPGVG